MVRTSGRSAIGESIHHDLVDTVIGRPSPTSATTLRAIRGETPLQSIQSGASGSISSSISASVGKVVFEGSRSHRSQNRDVNQIRLA